MKFFFPDSQDLVSPTYDFARDEYSPLRVRQRDDLYAHEVLDRIPYHGILVSKAIVDGSMRGSGKYSESQRARLYRLGVRRFFRLPQHIETLGDNGAFNYVEERVPPVSVGETLDFYEGCDFDAGASVDHVIFGYQAEATEATVDSEWAERRQLTLRLASDFMQELDRRGSPVVPVGVAQGWSPVSYADSVRSLQDLGYQRIALGGMVPLKTREILACLEAIAPLLKPETELHLFGITRVESMDEFADYGVTSFDSTSAFRQSFMDDRRNYHTYDADYVAIRVPQVEGNPALKRNILGGVVSQRQALAAERECLALLRAYDHNAVGIEEVLGALNAYEHVCRSKKSYVDAYRRTLEARPWKSCKCGLCVDHGIEIAIFRGTERNKRRGFHNLSVLATKMDGLKTHHPKGN